ncbi:MAG: hypothetical protein OXD54_18290 [Candidatus Poribacteria bacterium]|nr:hypothetical protein [Candidatus Poribacteria bacterium]
MKFSKILIFLVIGCAVGLLLVFGVRLQAQNSQRRGMIATNVDNFEGKTSMRTGNFRNWQQNSNRTEQNNSNDSQSTDDSDFYKAIVDNSLFRPLGWRPPNKEPDYNFIGTATDENGVISKAFLEERRSNNFYTAMVGDKVGDAVVKEIKENQIILDKNGESITLKGGTWQPIKAGGSNRSASSRSESDNNNKNSNASNNNDALRKAKETALRNEQMRKEMMERSQEMRRRFEGAIRERMRRGDFSRRSGRGR